MGRHRKSISELELSGGGNLARSLAYPAKRPLAHRDELEQLFADLHERRAEALEDVRTNGLVVYQDRYNNGKLYQIRVANPAVRILQATERQIANLAKMLTAAAIDEAGPGVKSDAGLCAEVDAMIKKGSLQ